MKNFFNVLINPLPVEVALSTELKAREIKNCHDIERLQDYAVAVTKNSAMHDYVLGAALARIIELEEKQHLKPSNIRNFLKKFI